MQGCFGNSKLMKTRLLLFLIKQQQNTSFVDFEVRPNCYKVVASELGNDWLVYELYKLQLAKPYEFWLAKTANTDLKKSINSGSKIVMFGKFSKINQNIWPSALVRARSFVLLTTQLVAMVTKLKSQILDYLGEVL